MNLEDERIITTPKFMDYRKLGRNKTRVLSSMILVLVFVFVFAVSICCNMFLQSRTPVGGGVTEIRIHTIITNLPLGSKEVEEVIQSKNRTIRKLPDLEMFEPNTLSGQFNERVLKFFDDGCDVKFFMTWISPVESFGNREILAVESVFAKNPRGCLLILSPTMDSPAGVSILERVLNRGFKLLAVTPDLPFLLKNTSAETWYKKIKDGEKETGAVPISQNLSNLMRLLFLYKYGGVYIDTDFIVLKSFKGLKNTIGAQSISDQGGSRNWTRLNNAVLVFDEKHPLVLEFIEEFASTFNGNVWGYNGPYLVSRVVRRVEGEKRFGDFRILDPLAFYPVNWVEIKGNFKKQENLKWVNSQVRKLQKYSYGIHLWNKKSKNFPIEEGSVIDRLVSDH